MNLRNITKISSAIVLSYLIGITSNTAIFAQYPGCTANGPEPAGATQDQCCDTATQGGSGGCGGGSYNCGNSCGEAGGTYSSECAEGNLGCDAGSCSCSLYDGCCGGGAACGCGGGSGQPEPGNPYVPAPTVPGIPTNTPRATNTPTSTPPDEPLPSSRWCRVSLLSDPSVPTDGFWRVVLEGRGIAGSTDTIDLFLQNMYPAGQAVAASPNPLLGTWVWTNPINGQTPPSPHTYYKVGECTSVNGSLCTTTIDVNEPIESFYAFHCQVFAPSDSCSGNPFCSYENEGYTTTCDSTSCSTEDHVFASTYTPPIQAYGSMTARAAIVDEGAACSVFNGVNPTPLPLPNTSFYLNHPNYSVANATQTQSGNSPVSWDPVQVSSDPWLLHPTPPVDYSIETICCTGTGTATCSSPNPLYATIPADNDTIAWNIGFSAPGPWMQTSGGDVLIGQMVMSEIPSLLSTYFSLENGTEDGAGLVSYGSDYDFSLSDSSKGETKVSSKGWLVANSGLSYFQDTWSWFTYFRDKFDVGSTADLSPVDGLLTLPGASGVYYVTHQTQTNFSNASAWSIPAGASIVLVVNGNFAINYPITLANPDSSFFAVIAGGNISVASTVGVPYNSSTPQVEGIFITDGTFATGASTAAATRRFVGRGTFIAADFTLQRNLEDDGQNPNTSSELFQYNPSFMFTMPRDMQDINVRWDEVAP